MALTELELEQLAEDLDAGGLGTLETDISNAQADIVTLQNDMSNAQTDIGNAQSDITALQSDDVATQLKSKYILALAAPKVHMEVDMEGLTGLSPLSLSDDLATACARAEALRTAMIDHMNGVGTAFADGEHKHADTANATTLAAVAPATDEGTLETLVDALHTASVDHGDETVSVVNQGGLMITDGVHFLDDTAETLDTLTPSTPGTLTDYITNLNELKLQFQAHFAKGSF